MFISGEFEYNDCIKVDHERLEGLLKQDEDHLNQNLLYMTEERQEFEQKVEMANKMIA